MADVSRRFSPAPTPAIRPRRFAFTLIELLVVVAIIALLISILIPALGAARDSSRRAVCMANLRAIGVALNTYAMDNKQQLPDYKAIGEVPFRVRYRNRLNMRLPNGSTNTSPYYEVLGVNAVLHTGKSPEILPNGLRTVSEPPNPIYCPADSKVWVCPGNPGPIGQNMAEWGNTYMYRCNSAGVRTNEDPNDSGGAIDPNAPIDTGAANQVYNMDWLGKNARTALKSPLIWDNYQKYPAKPCFVPTQQEYASYTVPLVNQQRPHKAGAFSFKKGPSGFWIAFYVDGHCQMNVMNQAQ
jgi:prepilin-type N-terminal cleavage/methylation domain-containing protein